MALREIQEVKVVWARKCSGVGWVTAIKLSPVSGNKGLQPLVTQVQLISDLA